MKKIISLFLAAVMLLSITAGINLSVFAETYSGMCGDDVYWNFDPDSGTLTIFGTGKMIDFDNPPPDTAGGYDTPWLNQDINDLIINIEVSNGVTSIGDRAFEYCYNLVKITISNSVTSIGYNSFHDCVSLTSITIPDSVNSINHYAFSGCSKLNSINIDEQNEKYSSINGVFFNKNKTDLIKYPVGKADKIYNIPDGVTSIENSAFLDCSSLTSITIPDGVTSIGSSAFFRLQQFNEYNNTRRGNQYSEFSIFRLQQFNKHNYTRKRNKHRIFSVFWLYWFNKYDHT